VKRAFHFRLYARREAVAISGRTPKQEAMMSPEWMIALDRAETDMRRRRTDPLSDPLEAEAWRGLEAVSALLSRLLNGRGRPEPRGRRRVLPDRGVASRAILRRF
jgi:hypothetical protein